MDGHGSRSVSMDDFPSAELNNVSHMNLRPVQLMNKFSKTLGDKKDAGFVDAGLQVEFLNYFWVMNLC